MAAYIPEPRPLPEPQYTLQLGSSIPRREDVLANEYAHVACISSVYATARAMGSLTPVEGKVGQGYDGGDLLYSCWQANYSFDFSRIPVGSTILSAVVTVVLAGNDSATDFTLEMRKFDYGAAPGGAAVPGASLASYDLLASVDTSTFGVGGAVVAVLTSQPAITNAIIAGGRLRANFSSSRQRLGTTPGAAYEFVTFSASTVPRIRATYRAPSGDEITLEIDAESLVFGSAMRGFASLECEADLETCNDVVSNQLMVGQDVVLFDNGVSCWEGEVVSLPRPSPEDPVQQIVCAGRFDRARRNETFGKWFSSDSTYESWREVPVRLLGNPGLLKTRLEAIAVDTDRQILLTIPNGTVYKVGQGVAMGFWLFDGQDPGASLSRVTCDVAVDPGATQWIFELYAATDLYGGPQAPLSYLGSYSAAAFHDKIDSDISAHGARALILYATAVANGTAARDYYIQLSNLVIYSGTQAARRIDEAIVEILESDSGIAASAQSEPIGAALANLVIDPDDTIAGAVEKIEARHSLPVLSGIWDDGELVVMEQPVTPPDRTRYYEVSVAQEGVVWDVQPDEEAGVEVVKVVYQPAPQNECLDPHPVSATLPASWTASSGCSSYNEGNGYAFRLYSTSSYLNPIMQYKPPDGSGPGIEVEAGVTYLFRCRALVNGWKVGQAHVLVRWMTAAGVMISQAYAFNASADAAWAWYTTHLAAPPGAKYAVLIMRWYNATGTPHQALRVRDVTFQPFVDADVELVEYVPAPPSSPTARMTTVHAGYTTRDGAIAAGEQYLEHYGSRASGPVQIPDFVRDVDGRLWPLSRIRAWDWVICTDYHDADARGPFMVTAAEIQNGIASLAIGGVDTYAFDPPEKALRRRGRFVGGRRVWKRVRRKVRGRWRWVRRRVWRKSRYV